MMLAAPAILLTAAVTVLAVLITQAMSFLVGRARKRHGVMAPTMNGPVELECALRVQGNTIEQLVAFLPALWLAALYFQGWAPPIIGILWCLGRILYWAGYMKAPGKRMPGFMITFLSTMVLAVLAIIGLVTAWTASAAA